MKIKKESVIYPLPSDSLILRKEEFWRVLLPIDYKSFIKVNNGGSPEKKSFVCNNRSYMIVRFLCILEAAENIEIGMFDIDVT